MRRNLVIYILGGLFIVSGCSKKGEKVDEYPTSTFKASLVFMPEATGTYATNQNESTISDVSLTSVTTLNFGIDSLRSFSVAFHGKVANPNGTFSTPDYDLTVIFKAPSPDGTNLTPGTYQLDITKSSGLTEAAGIMYVRNPLNSFPNKWDGSYPPRFFKNLPYSKVTITRCYTLNVSTGFSTKKKIFVDGSFEAYFVASGFLESSEVKVTGSFTAAEKIN